MSRQLRQLAQLYGVQTAYYDVARRRRAASVETLLAVLRAMDAPVSSLADVPQVLRQRRQEVWRRPLDHVVVAWDGVPPAIEVRLPESLASARLGAWLRYEDGHQRELGWELAASPVTQSAEVEGVRYMAKRVGLPRPLPPGYHRLGLELAGSSVEALVIAAPVRSYAPPDGPMGRTWGVFLPLYALHSENGWGADFSGRL